MKGKLLALLVAIAALLAVGAGRAAADNGGTQAAGQSAENAQSAQALSLAAQSGASNKNVPVRVLSPGNDGSTTQTNSASSGATAGNTNGTSQGASQTQAGSGCYCHGDDSGSQSVGQTA